MRWVCLLILIFAQCGCASVQEAKPPVVLSNNEQKDAYITKVEEVISESASGLSAVVSSIPDGIPRQIIEGQIKRLSGIAKPTLEKTREFERMIKDKDAKAVAADTERAIKVDDETNKLWAIVEEQNQKLDEANAMRVQAELTAKEERKTKMLYQASSVFLALCVIGILVEAFTPFKKAGFILIGLSTIFGGLLFYLY